MTIGEMRELVSIEKPGTETDDGYGGIIYGPPVTYQAWARIQNMKGSETVIAARMTGVQPVVITLYWTPDLASMTTAWAVQHPDYSFNVKSVASDERREFIEILAERTT